MPLVLRNPSSSSLVCAGVCMACGATSVEGHAMVVKLESCMVLYQHDVLSFLTWLLSCLYRLSSILCFGVCQNCAQRAKAKRADQVRSLPLLCVVLVQSRREGPQAMAQMQAETFIVWEESCDISGCHHDPNCKSRTHAKSGCNVVSSLQATLLRQRFCLS